MTTTELMIAAQKAQGILDDYDARKAKAETHAHDEADLRDALAALLTAFAEHIGGQVPLPLVWTPGEQAYRIGMTDRLIARIGCEISNDGPPDPRHPLKMGTARSSAAPLTLEERRAIATHVSVRLFEWAALPDDVDGPTVQAGSILLAGGPAIQH